MAKRKSSSGRPNDTKIAAIVTGLFAAVIILMFIFSKGKQERARQHLPQPSEVPEAYVPEGTEPHEPPAVSYPSKIPHVGKIPGNGGRIAFIIDDWGQSIANCKYLKEIHEPLAVSILPGLRHTKDVANCARQDHKLAMLHLPLEALHNYDLYPHNYIIKTTMSPQLVTKIVEYDLDQLPSIEGVNNHMGSKATEDRQLMRIIFKRIKRRGLFFVDSMTTPRSITEKLAYEMGISFAKRDVFLDNINTREAIVKQMIVLAQWARRHGYAIAIGHDRHLTMQVIKDEIPWLERQGFQIVSIKELLKR